MQDFLSPNLQTFPRPCLWDFPTFPLRNKDRIHKNIFTLPKPGSRGSEKGHEDLHSPFNLFRLTVLQQLSHLLPAALLIFWVFCKVVQDPGEATGCGVMAWGASREAWVSGLLQHYNVASTLTLAHGGMGRDGMIQGPLAKFLCWGRGPSPCVIPHWDPHLQTWRCQLQLGCLRLIIPSHLHPGEKARFPDSHKFWGPLSLNWDNLWNSIIQLETQAQPEVLDLLCSVPSDAPPTDLLLELFASCGIHGKGNQWFISIFMFLHDVTWVTGWLMTSLP